MITAAEAAATLSIAVLGRIFLGIRRLILRRNGALDDIQNRFLVHLRLTHDATADGLHDRLYGQLARTRNGLQVAEGHPRHVAQRRIRAKAFTIGTGERVTLTLILQ